VQLPYISFLFGMNLRLQGKGFDRIADFAIDSQFAQDFATPRTLSKC
jgi:hypothetical protein